MKESSASELFSRITTSLMQLLSMLILSKTLRNLIPLAIEKELRMAWDYWITNELQISNIQFHLFIQPRQSENRKPQHKASFQNGLFSCQTVSSTVTCQILAAFKIYVVPVFSENRYKLELSFAQFKLLQRFLYVEGRDFLSKFTALIDVHTMNRTPCGHLWILTWKTLWISLIFPSCS